jgi:drug/metabolite transporter (DMT)-like permease
MQMTALVAATKRKSSLSRTIGVMFVLIGAASWGISGNVAQFLFASRGIQPGWLTSMRMLCAGTLMLAVATMRERSAVMGVWRERQSRGALLIFGTLGMIGAQYTYFETVAAGNAATATLLQYLNPVLILMYFIIRWRLIPSTGETAAIFLAVSGVFFIVTKGHLGRLSIAPATLFWGLLSACGGALYSVQPAPLLKKWGTAPVIGWGMVIGGSVMSMFYPPWHFAGRADAASTLGILFVILIGTFLSFYLYLASLKFLQPIETSVLGCAEPLSATVVSVLWLHVPFTFWDWLGACCIILTVIILSLFPPDKPADKSSNV